jgi:hypothetical protein
MYFKPRPEGPPVTRGVAFKRSHTHVAAPSPPLAGSATGCDVTSESGGERHLAEKFGNLNAEPVSFIAAPDFRHGVGWLVSVGIIMNIIISFRQLASDILRVR